MIKKILLIFAILLALVACTKKPEDNPQPETKIESNLIALSADELKEKEMDCDYFVLFVYTDGCQDCSNFSGILEKYLKINKTKFYSIEDKDFATINSIAAEYLKKTPFLAVISKGEVLSYLNAKSEENKKYTGSVAGFTDWMKDKTEEYCLQPKEQGGDYCLVQEGC